MWEKIVLNLLSNAFKFTLAGEVTVRMRESDERALLEVIDSGTGIPDAELPRIFDRFHRVTGSIGRTHEGAGIGLALVRELVELHGGTIGVASKSGVGSTFRVEVLKGCAHLPADALRHDTPASESAADTNAHTLEAVRWLGPDLAAAESSAAEFADADADAATKPLVLVVDDNPDLRDHMRRLLAGEYRVLTADNGRAALDLVRANLPDIVLSDVMMPHMTGIELVQHMRADRSTAAVPVILLSARAGEESTVEGLDAGSDDYLTKPFTAHELLARVRAHVRLAQARRRFTAELEQSNRELDAFSYSVAHDLRAPLRSIDGFSQILLEEDFEQLSEDGRRRLSMVRSAAQRMSQLIDDLLYLAHLSRGEVRRIPFELSMLVRSVAAQLQEAKPAQPVKLAIADGVWVNADPHLLQILLENMLGNAWKFAAQRAVAEIEFGSQDADGAVCYYIRDNGAGFDMKYAAKLFGVFQRLHPVSEFPGTGVGLATVQRIVGRHGGKVWAVGEVGRGATFYFTLGEAVARSSTQSAASIVLDAAG